MPTPSEKMFLPRLRANFDYGKETIFVSDHTNNLQYGLYQVGQSLSGGVGQNLLPWFQTWNYPSNSGINSYKNAAGNLINFGTTAMTRDVINGRPYIRVRPNNTYVLGQAFAERNNDSRYSKTFQTVWITNTTTPVSNTTGAANNSRGISYTMNVGVDTTVWMPT